MIYLLFFLSGLSGLIYQVVWVRMFGNVFGNTIYSASIVVAVFMLGLGVGSYLVGAWADRRYAARPDSLLRAYGYVELLIAAMGLAIAAAAAAPRRAVGGRCRRTRASRRDGMRSRSASYLGACGDCRDPAHADHAADGRHAHAAHSPSRAAGSRDRRRRIALLYGINTAGAALGCALTDFALVPAWGLWSTQLVAVLLNAAAGVGALLLSSAHKVRLKPDPTKRRKKNRGDEDGRSVRLQPDHRRRDGP